MKNNLLFLCGFGFAVVALGGVLSPYHIGRVTVRVVDEQGNPVSNATAGIGFTKDIPAGEGWGTRANSERGQTDTNGVFSAEAKCNPAGSCSARKMGYYPTMGIDFRFTNVVYGRWQPWNPTLIIGLRKIGNPVPMYAKRVETQIPKSSEAFGFDLVAGDWIRPGGKGEVSDLMIRVDGYWSNRFDNAAILTVSFVNPLDGIQKMASNDIQGSIFATSREAPEVGYQADRTWRRIRKDTPDHLSDVNVIDYSDQVNYVFRVRTVTNEYGLIVSAKYGKIRGDMKYGGASADGSYLMFMYYLNPDGTRNLEFDPKQNLFRNLTSLEEVTAP